MFVFVVIGVTVILASLKTVCYFALFQMVALLTCFVKEGM